MGFIQNHLNEIVMGGAIGALSMFGWKAVLWLQRTFKVPEKMIEYIGPWAFNKGRSWGLWLNKKIKNDEFRKAELKVITENLPLIVKQFELGLRSVEEF